jgi:hypothetical protein
MEIGFHTFPNGKQYTYVRPEKTSGPIFLRNIIFLVNTHDNNEIAIVREWGATHKDAWEPPKGQMEWKEFHNSHIRPKSTIDMEKLVPFMRDGVLREMTEEAKVLPSEIKHLQLLPLSYAEEWPEAGKGAQLHYQFWTAKMEPKSMYEAQKRMKTLTNSDLYNMLPADMCEKDKIMWWKPRDGWAKIRGAFSKKMTTLFYKERERYGV